ncbi:UvrB/UvrC motif-containing protein [Luminiphilus sp.]|nr:UvrB/UvrC motif-containing protein [Luminiphilus sp.]
MQYEKAADIRDQITQLQNVQATQNIEGTRGDLDLMAVFTEHGHACVQVLFVRSPLYCFNAVTRSSTLLARVSAHVDAANPARSDSLLTARLRLLKQRRRDAHKKGSSPVKAQYRLPYFSAFLIFLITLETQRPIEC